MHLYSVRQNRLATFAQKGGEGWGVLPGRRVGDASDANGVYEFVARISAERTGGWPALCGAAASRCHRRQHSSYFLFPSFARTASAWLWVVREHVRMRVHVPLDVTLAQSSSIARQLAATGASRGSSRSSSKAGPLVAQHPRPRQIHVFIRTLSDHFTIHFLLASASSSSRR